MIAPRQWSTRFAWAKKSVNNKAYSSAVWFVSVWARQWASNDEPSNTPTFTFELPILMASSREFTMSLYAEQERGAIGIAPPAFTVQHSTTPNPRDGDPVEHRRESCVGWS